MAEVATTVETSPVSEPSAATTESRVADTPAGEATAAKTAEAARSIPKVACNADRLPLLQSEQPAEDEPQVSFATALARKENSEAAGTLFKFSAALAVIPVLGLFVCEALLRFVVENSDKRWLYSGCVAVLLVQVVLVSYVLSCFSEGFEYKWGEEWQRKEAAEASAKKSRGSGSAAAGVAAAEAAAAAVRERKKEGSASAGVAAAEAAAAAIKERKKEK
mmetsp:Transcript_34070/g.62796  ORF Transcript_34070/g.62796 Transcript_34070/m.62796 type:complete len:220 (-) Transcript_34070:2-661(-)